MTEAAASRTGTVAVNGTEIAYEIGGSGPPLVLLHAGICDRRMWDDQVGAFGERFTVLRYDMRGYGDTPMVPGDFAHRDDLSGLLRHLGVERAALVGCSQGGSTAVDFALEHPEMVSALVVVCSTVSGYPFTGDPPRQFAEIQAATDAGDIDWVNELEAQVWVDGPQREPGVVDQTVRQRVLAMNRIALGNELQELGQPKGLEPPAIERLTELHAPLLFVIGDLDQPAVVAAATDVASRVPGAQQVTIAGTAHLPNMEQPAEFNRIVLDFLAGVAAPEGAA